MFVSSHLMSEMALTADHLIVIGRGKLIADMGTRVHRAQLDRAGTGPLAAVGAALALLTGRGAQVTTDGDDAATSPGDRALVGDLAAAHQLTVHELFADRASLEEAFMELTQDSVDYHTDAPQAVTTGEVVA